MKILKNSFVLILCLVFVLSYPCVSRANGQTYDGQEDPNKKIIKNGLLGAATGAIASSASGGKAGKGALIGAGTNVIGGALLDSLTGSSSSAAPQPVYAQAAPVYSSQHTYVQQPAYPVQTQGTYRRVDAVPVYAQQPVYYQQAPPQEDPNKRIKVLKSKQHAIQYKIKLTK